MNYIKYFQDNEYIENKKEFIFSLWAVDYINRNLDIQLPEDEAGFIALHFVNASYKETTMKSVESTKIIKDILNIIKYYFSACCC